MLTDTTGAVVHVERDDARGLYLVRADAEEAGRTFFLDDADTGARVFFHTEVDERFGGRGLATLLVEQALTATRAQGLTIVPVCPLVRRFLLGHEAEWAGAFRRNTPADSTWVQQRLAQR